ncbi:hypothetical protein CsSME_00011052 [Camellia sinensis var. sinensis]
MDQGSEYSEERRGLPHLRFLNRLQYTQQRRGVRLTMSAPLWSMGNHICSKRCLVGGYLLDCQFVTYLMQHFIDEHWRALSGVEVAGHRGNFYIFRFASEADMHRVVAQGPYAVAGALLIIEYGRPNLVLEHLKILQYAV